MTLAQPTFRVAGLVGYKAASDIAGKAAVLAILILAARALPTRDFGLLALATTLGWMASVASDFGRQLYLGRVISRTSRPAAVLWPLFARRLHAGVLALVALVAVSVIMAPAPAVAAFVLIAAAPLITSVAEFLNYAYRGINRSELESTLILVQRLAALVLVWVGLRYATSLHTVGIALSASAVLDLAGSIGVAWRLMPREEVTPPAAALSATAWSREVAPIGIGLVLSALYFRVDVFLLERWTGVEAVALYSAAFRLVDALRLAPAAVLAVVLPRLFGGQDARFARQLALGLTGFGLAVTVALWPLTHWIVTAAYGSAYGEAAPVLQVLLLSFPLLALNYGLTHQLIGWDRQREYAVVCAVALAANLGLNTWLIPRLAGLGAAWATLGTEIVLTFACLLAIQRARTSR
jgi:O-antigen/teichoic acid export membrane protein